MENKSAFDFFQKMAETRSNGPDAVKLAHASDFSQMDADFIMKYANSNTSVLDLGSGSGLVINKIYDKVKHITAVEPFEGFTRFIAKSPNIKVVHQSVADFEDEGESYDLVTLFGVMHYFNTEEAKRTYEKYSHSLKAGGKIIIKNQLGVNEDVVVEGYSEEQQCNYYAEYRHVDKEVGILQSIGYQNVEVVDIYPPECNRWNNTHFYAIVAEKPA